ncbi:MAG: nucleotidyltransferase domain-containing protein [Kofleriaceae bacterium]|nr:nucleotidyltransferase domain-containing protein [Kofleriaceae bacterium]
MGTRLGGLADLDPAAVPLPVGTEVTTRVDRIVDGDVRPQGAAGRVAAVAGDRVDVVFLDGKRASYLRAEVLPRKLGVVRYAQRRAAAWDQLRSCVVIDTVVGSRAWGVSDAGSDEDHRGVFVLPLPWTTGLVEPPLDLTSVDGSQCYWELGKAIRQALRADPNTLEMLFASPVVVDAMGAELVAIRTSFLSQEIYGSFGRYALSQLDRLEHNQRLAEHRTTIVDWLRDDPSLELDAAATRLADSAAIVAPTRADAIVRARDYIKQLYRSMYDQGLIAANDWTSLRAAARTQLELPRDLRPKNAYNLIRLLDVAIRWLGGEPPDVRVSDSLRPTLLAIKRGEVPMRDVMALARELTPRLETARQTSPLPRVADVAAAERVLRAAREEAARRYITRSPGPWGTDAPAAPEARYDRADPSDARPQRSKDAHDLTARESHADDDD